MKNHKGNVSLSVFLALLVVGVSLTIIGTRIVCRIQFDRNCSGHLKRAADAITVEIAMRELETAVQYLEKNQLTSGYTSVIYTTPDEDVGFWYGNLKASLEELKTVKPDASKMERSNMLIKLRETLLDSTGRGMAVTCPGDMSVFPDNKLWFVLMLFSIIGGLTAAVYAVCSIESVWINRRYSR